MQPGGKVEVSSRTHNNGCINDYCRQKLYNRLPLLLPENQLFNFPWFCVILNFSDSADQNVIKLGEMMHLTALFWHFKIAMIGKWPHHFFLAVKSLILTPIFTSVLLVSYCTGEGVASCFGISACHTSACALRTVLCIPKRRRLISPNFILQHDSDLKHAARFMKNCIFRDKRNKEFRCSRCSGPHRGLISTLWSRDRRYWDRRTVASSPRCLKQPTVPAKS